ncbi:hypothetical protein HY522_00395 [bacterium]|nr:hypothetical protein [bacterium]
MTFVLKREFQSLRRAMLVVFAGQFLICAFFLDALGFARIGAFRFSVLILSENMILPHLQLSFLVALNVYACCAGLVLGVLQIRPETAHGMWPVLLTRPVGRGSVGAGKAAAGILILLVTLGAPLMVCTWVSLVRSSFASPFSWILLVPATASIVRGICVYLLVFYYSFSPQRNSGVVLCTLLAFGIVLLMAGGTTQPPLGDGFKMGFPLFLAAVLLCVSMILFARRTFLQWSVSPPGSKPLPWWITAFVSTALTIFPGAVVGILPDLLNPGPNREISVKSDGAAWLVSPGEGRLARVFDLEGRPLPEVAGPWPYEAASSTIRLDHPMEDAVERFSLNAKGTTRLYVPYEENVSYGHLTDDWNWFLDPGANRIVAYDPVSRERIGWLVPDGFHYETPAGEFEEIDDQADYLIALPDRPNERLLAAGRVLYHVTFARTHSSARKIAEFDGNIRRMGAGLLRFDRLSARGFWVALLTDSELTAFPLQENPADDDERFVMDPSALRRTRFPIGGMSASDPLSVGILDAGGFALFQRMIQHGPQQILYFDNRGQLARRVEVPYDAPSHPVLDDLKWLPFPAWCVIGFVVDRFISNDPPSAFFEGMDPASYRRGGIVCFIAFAACALLFRFYVRPMLIQTSFPYLTLLLFNVWGLWAMYALNHREGRGRR